MIAKPGRTTETTPERAEQIMADVARMRAEAEADGWTPARVAIRRAAWVKVRQAYPNQYVAYRERWSADRTEVEFEVLASGPTDAAVCAELNRRYPARDGANATITFCEWDPTGARAWRVLHLPRRVGPVSGS